MRDSMPRFPRLALTLVVSLVLLTAGGTILSGASAATATPSQGYVAYDITLTNGGKTVQSFVINETARPTGQNSLVQLTFNVLSNDRNLTYSKVVNSSSVPEIFPYVIGLNNQSFSYSTRGINLTARIVHEGTAQVVFNGKTYITQRSSLTFSISRSTDKSYSAAGTLLAMPSGLVYSLDVKTDLSYVLGAKLLATNLQLTSPNSDNVTTTFGFALVGLGLAGAVGLAVPSVFALVKTRISNRPLSPETPSVLVQTEEKP
ncbi:MAG TPA: hypothetical protein VE177_06465, partial [Candidatus Binatus sp.]|nr:hypothetical protein [Candidatus Binatus sp.]